MSKYTVQYTPSGNLIRIPEKKDPDRWWNDDRLSYRVRKSSIAILSPEDNRKLQNRGLQLKDLDLQGCLGGEVYKSSQVRCVCYQCGCKVFYYKASDNYPKICPLGHPAYEEL